uniref:diisopropyl-fluorophosphatase-like n=1 Tax=Styela clava TaxID=7725 RepID=UPI00193AB5C6|nr:diisopropyl-fluorophosphatase-like [Styela clava]
MMCNRSSTEGIKSIDKSQFRDEWPGKLHKINLETGVKIDVCTPLINGFGGRPAGCEADKFDNIWIADVRLGLLKYSPENNKCQLEIGENIYIFS